MKVKQTKKKMTSMLMIRIRPEEHRRLKIWAAEQAGDMSKIIRSRLVDIIGKGC